MKSPRNGLERYLPLAYMFMAFALIVMLLPTALRPPQAPPPTSSEFSPDAPPDEDQEILLTELSQGKSRTAGSAGRGIGVIEEEARVAPIVRQLPRKGRCFGTPPRQTDSTYSPPCAPAWVGNNKGSTWRGVTSNEIRIGMTGDSGDVGPVPTKESSNESSATRTRRVYQQYFNERFEMYGRQLRIYVVSGDSEASGSDRAAVQKADEEFGVFAMIGSGGSAEDEAIRRKLISVGGENQAMDRFTNNAPYLWSFVTAGTLLVDWLTTLICVQFVRKNVSFSFDPTMNGQPRVWGIVSYNDLTHYGYADEAQKVLGQCNEKAKTVVYMNIGDQAGEITTAMAKMQSTGVTSVILLQEGYSSAVMTRAATQQKYFPEWYSAGGVANDSNSTMKLADQNQWQHAVGITAKEMPAPTWQRDHYRAYKEIDPDHDPDGGSFYNMLQFSGGVQQTGPQLTPFTFQEGMFKRWPVRPDEHFWAVWGGYEPGRWTYPAYVKLEYWDPGADDPNADTLGAYRFMYGGRGFKIDEFPQTSPWHCYYNGDAKPDTSNCNTVIWISRDGETRSW